MSERVEKCYKNPFDDNFAKDNTITAGGELHPDFADNIQGVSESMLKKLHSSFNEKDSDDYSVYTGSTGIALLYFLVASKQKKPEYFERAWRVVKRVVGDGGSKGRLKGRRVSFLNGDAGPLALGAVLAHHMHRPDDARSLASRVEELLPAVVSPQSDVPDEVLYGRAGYLYSLLFLNKYMGDKTVDPSSIKQVVAAILRSGRALSQQEKSASPLMFMWHDKRYVGAAHGIAGILYMLLQAHLCGYVTRADVDSLVRPTLDFVVKGAFSSGNFPSSLGNGSDRLVQWCHGAPGLVDLLLLAHKVYGDDKYLRTALRSGDLVWDSGILRKSYGVCHGVAGNGYTFLALFNATKDPKHLHRACKFAEWCTSYGKYQSRTPDRPLSLFEGVAGAIYFLVDILDPKDAQFPAYCL